MRYKLVDRRREKTDNRSTVFFNIDDIFSACSHGLYLNCFESVGVGQGGTRRLLYISVLL